MENARERGWSWQQIADALGVSRQAVHKKHGGRRLPVPHDGGAVKRVLRRGR